MKTTSFLTIRPIVAVVWTLIGLGSQVAAAELKSGDRVVTVQDGVELGFKDKPVKNLSRGAELVITEVRDPWIGGTFEENGEKHVGWIHKREVRRAAVAPTDLPEVKDEASAAAALAKFGVTVEKDDEDHVQVIDAIDTGLTYQALP